MAKGDVLVLELAVASLKQYMRINVNIKKNLSLSVYKPLIGGGEWLA